MDDQYPQYLTRDMYQNSQEVLHVQEGNTAESPPEKKKRRAPLGIIGFMLIAVSVGIAGGYYLVNNGVDLPQLIFTQESVITPTLIPQKRVVLIPYTDATLSFSYPDSWTYEQSSGANSQVLFYSLSMDSQSKAAALLLKISYLPQPFAEAEQNLAQKDIKSGAYVTDIKTVTYAGRAGYAYIPRKCGISSCAAKEIILPLDDGTRTLQISSFTQDTVLFEQLLISLQLKP
ncbi:hypothetical protein BH11PAT1_BH11PAT1_7830 [soil metagenome]